jgi:hypothetical protein
MSELDDLREATRPRLAPKTVAGLRDMAEAYLACGERADRELGHGLNVLLDMHDKLEAIRHGQG